MICPKCGGETKVTGTRIVFGGKVVRRRRMCLECGCKETTYEVGQTVFDGSCRRTCRATAGSSRGGSRSS